jgi:YD repeat-containing protein
MAVTAVDTGHRKVSRVTDSDDGHVVEWRHPLGHRWRWELAPSSADPARVTETFDYSQAPAGI